MIFSIPQLSLLSVVIMKLYLSTFLTLEILKFFVIEIIIINKYLFPNVHIGNLFFVSIFQLNKLNFQCVIISLSYVIRHYLIKFLTLCLLNSETCNICLQKSKLFQYSITCKAKRIE